MPEDKSNNTLKSDDSDSAKENAPVKPAKKAKSKSDTVAKLKSEIKNREKVIETLKTEVKQFKDDYLRQLADKDNLRKRLEKEKSDYFQYALSESLKELLVVLDNFERALKTQDDEADEGSFRDGVNMIFRQLQDVLNKQGVNPVEIDDITFDPRFHQALATEESEDVTQAEIAEIYQTGYLYRDRLLRPALVKVVVPAKKKDQ